MSVNKNTQWSSKIKKFGITDPFLKLITVKYEDSIPWQTVVKDQEALNLYVKDVLLPELKTKATWDCIHRRSAKSLFVYFADLDVEQILETDELTRDEKSLVDVHLYFGYEDEDEEDENYMSREEAEMHCKELAALELATILNTKKEAAFKVWFDNVEKKYPTNYGFQYLILKPIIEQSGYNSRRLLTAPDTGVLKWLLTRIKLEFYIPSSNFGFEYRMRLANGLNSWIKDGWQFIPSGTANTARLTAAAARSGWCIAGHHYAHFYLSTSCFYILRENGKPVVALRVGKQDQVFHEIRGVNNCIASKYYSEIWFFIRSIFPKYTNCSMIGNGAFIKGMVPNFSQMVTQNIEKNNNNLSWWQEMTFTWPGTYDLVPDQLKSKVKFDSDGFLTNQFYMSLGFEFRQKHGLHFSESEYINVLMQHPQLYDEIGITDNLKLDTACIKGALNRLVLDDITLKEYSELPEFVRKSPEIITQINAHLPLSFEKKISKRGSNFAERNNPLKLEDHLLYSPDEPEELTILRALEAIIKNQSSDFTDIIFPKAILNHSEFKEIRKKAWLQSVLKNPTFYFAFPADLIEENVWSPKKDIDEKHQKTLNSWITRIQYRPWYLESENKVPKSVRHHEALLRAYLFGWGEILKKNPSRIWKKVNSFQRVYMSYAALRNYYIFTTIVNAFGTTTKWYSKSSSRMRAMPAYQLAVIYSAVRNNTSSLAVRKLIVPLSPAAVSGIPLDPLRALLQMYPSRLTQLIYLINKKHVSENFYFNQIDPATPVVRKIHVGSLVELVIDGELKRVSIDLEVEGFELIPRESAEAKILFSQKEGDIIPEYNIEIKKIL